MEIKQKEVRQKHRKHSKSYKINYKKIAICSVLLFVLSFSFPFFNFRGNTINAGQVTVFIDPGHGGSDPGCIQNGYREADINLSISLKLKSILEGNGYRVIMKRTNNSGMSNQDIVNMANASGANLFVSVHCNSSLNPAIQGIETYWSASNPSGGSSQFATSIYNAVVQATGRPGRVLRSGEFIVTKYTTMPAALVECGFLSNPEEAQMLNSDDYQNRAAQGIANGIHAYVNSAGVSGAATTTATGEKLTGDVLINIDTPKNNQTVGGVITLEGWAIDKSATVTTGITAVHVYDGPANGQANFIGQATLGIARPDVAASFGKGNLAPSGFRLSINTASLAKGTHVLHIYANNEAVGWRYTTVVINVVNDGSAPAQTQTQTQSQAQTQTTIQSTQQTSTSTNTAASSTSSGAGKVLINIDTPKANQSVNDTFTLAGWAIETSSTNSTGITAIHIYDGPANGEKNFLTAATYGIARPDVATHYGKANFANSGFSAQINLSKLSNGAHTLYVYAYNYSLGWKWATVNINVGGSSGSSAPQQQVAGITENSNKTGSSSGSSTVATQSANISGSKYILINVDTPSANSSVGGDFEISGWAADKNSSSGSGINMIHVYDGPANGPQNMIGVAAYGIARPDVATAFRNGNITNCGFNIKVDSSRLTQGQHTIYIYANNPEIGWKYVTLKVNVTSGGGQTAATNQGSAAVSGGTNIVGYVPVSVDQLLRPFVIRGSSQIDRARRLANLYIKWGQAFNIRTDIAWAQMCHETGCLDFGGVAQPGWNNFAGIGITGPGAMVTFASEELGVIAHYAHLAWYVYPNHVNEYCSANYDPRHIGAHRFNGDSSINCLNSRWAPAADYANKIIYFANQIWG